MLDDKAAPLKALLIAVSGMVSDGSVDAAKADASANSITRRRRQMPHASDAIIAIAAKAGLGVNAGQSLQLANGETVTMMSGQDTQFITGGQMRVHSGQAIGVLGGAVKPGEGNIGLQMIAAKDAIDIQAQSDELISVQARDEVNVISANAHIDWAAAKSISLSTAGGANITIEGGNITVQCPGKITIHAGKKSFTGPEKLAFECPHCRAASAWNASRNRSTPDLLSQWWNDMLIDSFAEGLTHEEFDPSLEDYPLIHGGLIPRLHRKVENDRKTILFEPLPGCSDEAKDVSPFLMRFDSAGKRASYVLRSMADGQPDRNARIA